MMADGIPASPLQRYCRHEHLDPTIIFIEVTVSLLRRDYCQGISVLNPGRKNLSKRELAPNIHHYLRHLVEELKTQGLEQSRCYMILDIIPANFR